MTLGPYAKALRSKRRRPHAQSDPERAPEWAPMGTTAANEEQGHDARIAA
jgi:hypothetical protein